MRYIILLVALTMIVTAGSGCDAFEKAIEQANKQKTSDDNKTKTPPRVIIPVEAERPTRGNISSYYETNSRVSAEKEVNIIPEAAEKCLSVNVDEGDQVQKGDILAELDKRNIQTQISEQETQVSKLRIDRDRAKQSFDWGIGAEAEYDGAEAGLKQGEAALERLRLQLRNLTLRSPITGIVTMRSIQVGQLVSTGSPVFTLVDPTSYILEIKSPEQEVARLKQGQTAKVTLDAVANEEFGARVRRISPHVDVESGTVKVTLDFDQATMKRLLYAAFARVSLVMETREDALLVPKDAVVEEGSEKYVFVLKPEEEEADSEEAEEGDQASEPETDKEGAGGIPVYVAERMKVKTGLEDSASIEIVEGITDESMIVTLGQQSLKPGSLVKVTNAEAEMLAKAGLSAPEALKAAQEKRDAGARDVTRRRGF